MNYSVVKPEGPDRSRVALPAVTIYACSAVCNFIVKFNNSVGCSGDPNLIECYIAPIKASIILRVFKDVYSPLK